MGSPLQTNRKCRCRHDRRGVRFPAPTGEHDADAEGAHDRDEPTPIRLEGDVAEPFLGSTLAFSGRTCATAVAAEVGPRHVRASAAIPFLFPSVRIGDHYYVDGGLRMNTPLAPAVRLGANRVLVIGLSHGAPAAVSEKHCLKSGKN